MASPMEQFEIKPIIPLSINGVDVSFTNSALFMVLAVLVCTLMFALCLRKRSLVPSISQSVPEVLYEFVHSILKENVGVEGLKYFPFIFSIFIFVAFGNLLGFFPKLRGTAREGLSLGSCSALCRALGHVPKLPVPPP